LFAAIAAFMENTDSISDLFSKSIFVPFLT
jgi:hypothetical protein